MTLDETMASTVKVLKRRYVRTYFKNKELAKNMYELINNLEDYRARNQGHRVSFRFPARRLSKQG